MDKMGKHVVVEGRQKESGQQRGVCVCVCVCVWEAACPDMYLGCLHIPPDCKASFFFFYNTTFL